MVYKYVNRLFFMWCFIQIIDQTKERHTDRIKERKIANLLHLICNLHLRKPSAQCYKSDENFQTTPEFCHQTSLGVYCKKERMG